MTTEELTGRGFKNFLCSSWWLPWFWLSLHPRIWHDLDTDKQTENFNISLMHTLSLTVFNIEILRRKNMYIWKER